MSKAVALIILAFGVVVALLASGSIRAAPMGFRWPEVNLVLLCPIVAFATLAVAVAAKPSFLDPGLVTASALALAAVCLFLLPPAQGAQSTDGQSGLFEAWVAFGTIPAAAVLLAACALMTVVARRIRSGA